MVIAVLFNAEWHQGYGNPPNNNPFDAYYVDKVTATTPFINSASPSEPIIMGPGSGQTGYSYNFSFVSSDPEEEDVLYWIEWDDGDFEEWIGPSTSGNPITRSHIWTEPGTYEIRAKAKDIHDAESNWSETFILEISEANLEIDTITGGFATIQTKIRNNLPQTLTDIQWMMKATGGLSNLININEEGIISTLGSNDTETILPSKPVFGFGLININVTVSTAEPPSMISKNAQAVVLGVFVIVIEN
jgi:hypothetical protein